MEARSIPPPSSQLYEEFLRSSDLSIGVYRLPPGAVDSQQPHAEDEVYYVLRGRAEFTSGGSTIAVTPGLCLAVPAREAHRFHDIIEELELLVIFGPAEGTRS
jgi:mannose-6-phosphate isomerase-like protein (cupin superfamily)